MRNAPRALATPVIYETANSEHLGNILATFDTNKLIRSKRTIGISLLIVGVVVALIGVGMVANGGEAGEYIIFGIPIFALGAGIMYGSRPYLGKARQSRAPAKRCRSTSAITG